MHFCQYFWGISFLHRQFAFRVFSQLLHRQLTLLCSLIFSIVSGATFISCRMIWLCCLQEFGRLPSHPSAACRGWEEKRGGQVDGSLVETCTPCHSIVGLSFCSATTGELQLIGKLIANSDERRQDAGCIVSCGCSDDLYLGTIEVDKG